MYDEDNDGGVREWEEMRASLCPECGKRPFGTKTLIFNEGYKRMKKLVCDICYDSAFYATVDAQVKRDLMGLKIGHTYELVCLGETASGIPVYEQVEK